MPEENWETLRENRVNSEWSFGEGTTGSVIREIGVVLGGGRGK